MFIYGLCSNPECKWSKRFDMNRPRAKKCPLCGQAVMYACPHCNNMIEDKNARFCTECGDALKPAPPPQKKTSVSQERP